MNAFFLLKTNIGRKLYAHVKDLPIVDYHNHLSITDIFENKRFFNVYELWIKPDPYKHRAMRMCGVPEKYITGNSTDEEKFIKWCETVPKLQLNALSHWSKMELEKVFGIKEPVTRENAKSVYDFCNRYLEENVITAESLLKTFCVEYASPCASLVDDIAAFEKKSYIAPSLRGDDILALSETFIKKLEVLTKTNITSLQELEQAIKTRLDVFKKCGCCFSDHALDNGFKFFKDDGCNAKRFEALLSGNIEKEDKEKLSSYMLVFLGKEYAENGFVLQLHIGAQRYTSTNLRKKVGAMGGFAGIGNSIDVISLTEFLDTLDSSESGLAKTVLFTLNPADNALISVLSGSYAKDGESALITQGPAWWWCDHKQGMLEMLENTASFGMLSNFIGMTTDSRSFLSFIRHDYFRRVLCDWLGEKWEAGEILCDMEELKELAHKLCYQNAKDVLKR